MAMKTESAGSTARHLVEMEAQLKAVEARTLAQTNASSKLVRSSSNGLRLCNHFPYIQHSSHITCHHLVTTSCFSHTIHVPSHLTFYTVCHYCLTSHPHPSLPSHPHLTTLTSSLPSHHHTPSHHTTLTSSLPSHHHYLTSSLPHIITTLTFSPLTTLTSSHHHYPHIITTLTSSLPSHHYPHIITNLSRLLLHSHPCHLCIMTSSTLTSPHLFTMTLGGVHPRPF